MQNSRVRITYSDYAQGLSVSASATAEVLESGSASSAISRTEYFANGMIIQSANNDYVLMAFDPVKGMVIKMENKNSYGIRCDSTGLFGRDKATGVWKEIMLKP